MTCRVCGRESPNAAFCTWCGADQATAGESGIAGPGGDHFAAHPGEHVMAPAIVTTLLPHLNRRNVQEYRWALVGGLAVIVLLYAAGLITAAIIASAVLVPVVYVMYLYEVSVWRDAPLTVLGLTIAAGFVIGVVLTLIFDAIMATIEQDSRVVGSGLDFAGLLLPAVFVPIVQNIIKPLPVLLLRRRYTERLDGLVFGVAAGLGYAAAETLIHFSRVITSLPVQTDPANWIYPLITIAILTPLLHGTTTGAITGALWRSGRRSRFAGAAIAAAFVVAVLFVLGSRLLTAAGVSPLLVLAWQLVVVVALVLVVRLDLHHALMEEAQEMGVARTTCWNCGSDIHAAGFCPVCGMALAAAPRDERGGRRNVQARSEPGGPA